MIRLIVSRTFLQKATRYVLFENDATLGFRAFISQPTRTTSLPTYCTIASGREIAPTTPKAVTVERERILPRHRKSQYVRLASFALVSLSFVLVPVCLDGRSCLYLTLLALLRYS